MMNERLLSSVVLAGVMTLTAGAASAAEKLVLQLGWLPGGDRAQYYVASQLGLFQAEGLEVQIVSGKGSNDAITKVATGVADIGEGGLDALLTAKVQNEIPVTAVMPVYTKVPDSLITTADSGIKSLKDVTGKKVGTSPFTSSNAPWPFLLRMNGIDPASVTVVKADPSAHGSMLATGNVDAIIQYVTNAPATASILAEAKKTMHVIPWADYGLEGYSASLFVSHKTLATRREAVVKFVRAVKKAEEIMRDDPGKAAAAVKAAVPELDAALMRSLVMATLPLIFNENTQRDGLGIFNPALVQTTWQWVAKQQNAAAEKLDPMNAVDLQVSKP